LRGAFFQGVIFDSRKSSLFLRVAAMTRVVGVPMSHAESRVRNINRRTAQSRSRASSRARRDAGLDLKIGVLNQFKS
jgi:hypothetical protein